MSTRLKNIVLAGVVVCGLVGSVVAKAMPDTAAPTQPATASTPTVLSAAPSASAPTVVASQTALAATALSTPVATTQPAAPTPAAIAPQTNSAPSVVAKAIPDTAAAVLGTPAASTQTPAALADATPPTTPTVDTLAAPVQPAVASVLQDASLTPAPAPLSPGMQKLSNLKEKLINGSARVVSVLSQPKVLIPTGIAWIALGNSMECSDPLPQANLEKTIAAAPWYKQALSWFYFGQVEQGAIATDRGPAWLTREGRPIPLWIDPKVDEKGKLGDITYLNGVTEQGSGFVYNTEVLTKAHGDGVISSASKAPLRYAKPFGAGKAIKKSKQLGTGFKVLAMYFGSLSAARLFLGWAGNAEDAKTSDANNNALVVEAFKNLDAGDVKKLRQNALLISKHNFELGQMLIEKAENIKNPLNKIANNVDAQQKTPQPSDLATTLKGVDSGVCKARTVLSACGAPLGCGA